MKNNFFWREKSVTFEIKDKTVNYASVLGFKDITYQFAHNEENIYFMLHQKHLPSQETKTSTVKNEYIHFYKTMMK